MTSGKYLTDSRGVQPVQLPHGHGLAARQRPDRRWLPPLRPHADAARVARGLFDATERFQANRLPELFAGLPRDDGSLSVQYLGASVPQAWAAGSIFRLIAVLCGIHATTDRAGSRLYVDPALPDWLPELTIRNLRAGTGTAGLRFHGRDVEVLSNTTGFEIIHTVAPRPTPWSHAKPKGQTDDEVAASAG